MNDKIKTPIILILASVLFAFGINMFLVPSQVVAGGFTGLAHVINIVFDLPIGIMVVLLNIPFLIANSRILGKIFLKKAIIGVLLSGLMTDIFKPEPIINNRLLNAIFGGALLGFSMGTMFSLGYTTGGTDFVATLIREKNKKISVGRAIFYGDFFIILLSFFVVKDFLGVLLAVISIYVQTRTIDITMNRLAEF